MLNFCTGVVLINKLLTLIILLHSVAYADFDSEVDLGFAGDFYFNNQDANNGQAFVDLFIQKKLSHSEFYLDVGAGGLAGNRASHYIKVPQLFYRQGDQNKLHAILGRSYHQWSVLDEFWNLGKTQPLFGWDQSQLQQQGLTGLFIKYPFNGFSVTLFGSYLFLPEQGPTYDHVDGRFEANNPWFKEPVEVINLNGQRVDLSFDVQAPKTQDVIFQESVGIQLSRLDQSRGLLLNAFYLNKASNELILPFEGTLNLTSFTGDITIKPAVARHWLMGVDLGWSWENLSTVLSWMYESELDYQVPASTTFPIIPEQNMFSIRQFFQFNNQHRFWFGYLKSDREENAVGGVFATSQLTTFRERNRFDEVFRLQWEGLFFDRDLTLKFGYNQSFVADTAWLNFGAKWHLNSGLSLTQRCDLFGGAEEEATNRNFISSYQNNDRCLVGGLYTF